MKSTLEEKYTRRRKTTSKEELKMAKAKKGDLFTCELCGLVVAVDESCDCVVGELICCDIPMEKGKAKMKKAAKPAKKAAKKPVKKAAPEEGSPEKAKKAAKKAARRRRRRRKQRRRRSPRQRQRSNAIGSMNSSIASRPERTF